MYIVDKIRDLKDFLLKKFEKKIASDEKVSQLELEMAVREHQGGPNVCPFTEAKVLINLLWDFHAPELVGLYRLVDPSSGLSLEVKRTFEEAYNWQ